MHTRNLLPFLLLVPLLGGCALATGLALPVIAQDGQPGLGPVWQPSDLVKQCETVAGLEHRPTRYAYPGAGRLEVAVGHDTDAFNACLERAGMRRTGEPLTWDWN